METLEPVRKLSSFLIIYNNVIDNIIIYNRTSEKWW